jgi:ABC-type uncharacterized transport system permease subunit
MAATHGILAGFMLAYAVLAGLHYWLFLGKKTALGFRWRHALLGVVLAAHTPFVVQPFLAGMGGAETLGLGMMATLVTWVMMVLFFSANFFHRLDGLHLLLGPFMVLALCLQWQFPSRYGLGEVYSPVLMLHLFCSIIAYSIFALAALMAVLIYTQNKALHQKRWPQLLAYLPPLLSLEKWLFQLIWVGFALLTVSLISGAFYLAEERGVWLIVNHKVLFALLSWMIFCTLLLGRYGLGWRGQTAARWVVIGFVFLLLGYAGSKMVTEWILHR